MNNFAWAVKMLFLISGTSRAHFSRFKVCTNMDTTLENVYTVKLACPETPKKNWPAFLLRLPLSRHIARLATFSIDPGILISLYASAHHPYTTLATGEWMIFWSGEDSPVKVRSTECSRHLVFQSSLHVRLLLATLQLTHPILWYSLNHILYKANSMKPWYRRASWHNLIITYVRIGIDIVHAINHACEAPHICSMGSW